MTDKSTETAENGTVSLDFGGAAAPDGGGAPEKAAEPKEEAAAADTESEPSAADSEPSVADSEAEATDDPVARLEGELAEARDELLRAQAEMQNLRRRSEQDVEKAHKFGQERFAGELLTVVDNLERALKAASDSNGQDGQDEPAVKAIRDGVELTLKSFMDCFKRFAVETVDPMGEPFDPALHQAMATQENDEAEPDTVIAVMQKGYTLHGRVLRPAMVMVSKSPEPQAPSSKTKDEPEPKAAKSQAAKSQAAKTPEADLK